MSINKIGNSGFNQFSFYEDPNMELEKTKNSSFYENENEIKDLNLKEEDIYELDIQINQDSQNIESYTNDATLHKTNGVSCNGSCTNCCATTTYSQRGCTF